MVVRACEGLRDAAVIAYHSLEDAIVKDFATRTSGHAFDPVTHGTRAPPGPPADPGATDRGRSKGAIFALGGTEARPSSVQRGARPFVSASPTTGSAALSPSSALVRPTFRTVTRHCLTPTRAETELNVRARSARMRVLERTDALLD